MSALAIVRLSGLGCGGIVERMMGLDEGRLRGSRRAVGPISAGGRVVDTVVAIAWPVGGSFTGEEMVEITCHGNPAITAELVAGCAAAGARAARAGEFTRRALLNGRLTALEVVALSTLWQGDVSRGMAEVPRGGAVDRALRQALETVEQVATALEGRLEFGESHGVGESGEAIRDMLESALRQTGSLRKVVAGFDVPCSVLIMGPRNAGKSSLFNRLAGSDLAVVSEEAGTTRDGVMARIGMLGRAVELFDTAGTGGTGTERRAVDLAVRRAGADARVLWLSEGGREPVPEGMPGAGAAVLRIASKSDRVAVVEGLGVSAVTGEGIAEVEAWIADGAPMSLVEGVIAGVDKAVGRAGEALAEGDEDIAAEEIAQALEGLGGLADGRSVEAAVEAALGRLCVGK